MQLTKAADGVKQYQAKQAQAEAALEAANSKVLAAQYVLTRKEDLVKKELVNQVDADVGRAQLNEARALVQAEQNRLARTEGGRPEREVKLAQLQLIAARRNSNERGRNAKNMCSGRRWTARCCACRPRKGTWWARLPPGQPSGWRPRARGSSGAEVSQEFAGRVQEGVDVQVEDEASAVLAGQGPDRRSFGLVFAAPSVRCPTHRRQYRPDVWSA